MKSYQDFKNTHLGRSYDVDGSAGAQCWDGYAEYCRYLGYPYANCTATGYAADIWTQRASNGMLNNFNEVSKSQVQAGDIVVFPSSDPEAPYSHVAIYDSPVSGNYANFLGENQAGVAAFSICSLDIQYAYPTVFRPKCFVGGGQTTQPTTPTKPTNPSGGFPIPSSGTFEFTYSDISILDGKNGLEGADTGYVYNAGMTVHYDSVYEKDGYLWISYISYSGARRSVAVRDKDGTMWGHAI